jgi:hypothetical protein
MRSMARVAGLAVLTLSVSACLSAPNNSDTANDKPVAVEKPFVGGGKIEMQLSGGTYEVRAAADGHIRLNTSGHTGDTKAEITAEGKTANVKVTDTPHNNFQATIDVPKTTDLVIRLTGGDLTVASIVGNKDVESYGGNVTIAVSDPNDYASVDAAVKAGEIDAKMFGESKSGLLQHFTWSGRGTHTLRANLGAGNLRFRSN